jgi:hypothetical protein
MQVKPLIIFLDEPEIDKQITEKSNQAEKTHATIKNMQL